MKVWLKIVDSIQNVDDLRNVNSASSFMKELIAPRKAEKLFPAVWEILGKKLHQNHQWLEENLDNASAGARITDDSSKWFENILSLRLVNKVWKDAIDKFYYTQSLASTGDEGMLYAQMFCFTNPDPTPLKCLGSALELFFWNQQPIRKDKSITAFLAHFEHTHGNGVPGPCPFFAKHVQIFVPSQKNAEGFRSFNQECSQLLSKYDQHILICKFKFLDAGITPETFTMLWNWLLFLPNLVSLGMHFTMNYRSIGIPFSDGNESTSEMINQLNLLTASQSLPKLEKLQRLNIFNVCPLIANHLLQVNSHVTLLRLHPGRRDDNELLVHTVPFLNLKALDISYPEDIVEDFLKLETVQFSSSFRSLGVYFEDLRPPPLREMFAMWGSKWASSLAHLKIYIPLLNCPGDEEGWLPKTQEIEALQREYLPKDKRLQLFKYLTFD